MQFDDFEDNLNLAIKWLTIISLIAIVIWCIIALAKLFIPKDTNSAKNRAAEEMVKDNETVEASDEAVNEILDLGYTSSAEDELNMFLNEEDAQTSSHAGYTFKLNVKEMPDKLYFDSIKNEDLLQKKREIINQKVGENYIDSVLSYGTLERWNPESFPLKVYIQKPPEVPPSHINEIYNAFTKWADTTNGFISFQYVDSPEQADIICDYPQDFYRSCSTDQSSVTSKQYFTYDENGYIKKSNIDLTYKDCNGEIYAEDLVYAFALREIGHSLGLRGHSGIFKNKVLYYPVARKNESVRPEINVADINTLKLIYSVLPDKTNTEFSEEQRKKLIKPEEIWGDTIERSVTSEKAILYNIERSPDIPSLHIALANYYSEHGQYDEALAVYSRSIVLLNDAAFKARVYVKVGDTYSSQHRYLEALEAYKLSLKSLNDKNNLFNVYFNLGFIYYQQAKYNDSLKAFQTAIQFVGNKEAFHRLLMNLACVYIKVGNYADAQKCADKAYSIRESKCSTYIEAYTRFLNGDYEGAEKFAAISVDEYNSLMGYGLLAQIYYRTEQYAALKKLQAQANEAFPNNPPFEFK